MKVLFPFVGDSVGGSHRSTIELYKALKSREIDAVILLHYDNGPLSKLLKIEKIPYKVLSVKTLAGGIPKKKSIIIGILKNMFSFSKFLISHKVNIVHGNDLRVNLTWSLPTLLTGKKFVWHQRTILSKSKLWKCIPFMCNFFIGISKLIVNGSPSNMRKRNKKLVYNPFNVDKFFNKKKSRGLIKKRFGISNRIFLIGYIGRVVNSKNIDFIIESLPKLKNLGNRKVHFLIVGRGETEYINQLKKKISILKIKKEITFSGFVSNPEEIISGIDLLVSASVIDGFGRSLVEAMIQKTPVLAAAGGGHTEIIQDKKTGFLYNPDDYFDFKKKLNDIIFKNYNIRKIVSKAQKNAIINYSIDTHVTKIIKIYKNL